MAAGTLINLTNFVTGIALNETGINISDLKISCASSMRFW